MDATPVREIVISLLLQTPMLLVCLASCIIIIMRWQLLRSAAIPAFIGSLLGMLQAVAWPVFWIVLTPLIMKDKTPSQMEMFYRIINFVQTLGWAIATGLLVLGVLLGRSATQPAQRLIR
jgi:hypothetical protein